MRLLQQELVVLTSSSTSHTLRLSVRSKDTPSKIQKQAHSIHTGMISHSYVGSDMFSTCISEWSRYLQKYGYPGACTLLCLP